jgi:hypothetical protein
MARPRKPTAILALTGRLKKDPKRYRDQGRDDEPQPVGDIGPPPEYFDEAQRARWAEFVADCAPGVLTKHESKALEVASCLAADFRRGKLKVPELALYVKLLVQFGLTPAARSHVKVPVPHGKRDPLKKYFSA